MPFFSLSIQNDFVIIAFRVNFLIPQNQFLNGSAFILFVYLLAFSSANVRSYHGALVTGSQMKHLTLPHMSSLQDILSLLTPLICITNCNKNLNSKKKKPKLFISVHFREFLNLANNLDFILFRKKTVSFSRFSSKRS